MSNHLDILINYFENVCRTCLARENLKPLYEKCSLSACPAEMLMSCTFVKFTEDDGLPVQICTNCIHEIQQAFSFAMRCETTDKILRNCLKKVKTEINSSQSEKVEVKEELKIEVLKDYRFVEVKQEEDVKIEYDEVKQEEDVILETEYVETDPADDEYQDEMYMEKSNNSHIEEESSNGLHPFANGRHLLKARQRREKKAKSRDFQCTECDQVFTTKPLLRRHSLIHRKGFIQMGHLKKHKLIHAREKPNVCSVCSKAFTKISSLKCHMRLHTGEKPYSCEVCSKTFAVSSHLKYHMRKHTGEKPYSCTVCSKAFAHAGILKSHVRIHSGEKLYSCEVCSKTFIQSTHLQCHMRIHTGEKPFSCEVCSKTFVQSPHLKYHMRIHL